ncbi:MAG: pyridoxal phosphate-dependent aminotransferase [Chloroflexi bacterium]|nr:pyridoxal phosphate-dependent aminotransferase [Chloroflexota bacterium]MBT3669324.1 pyridoxal phosphate-dependent aminotransferase [Chloroflexota bacterium]MBT4003477.1 pyridoxal phosphate-dependent aminotransferase [Chloroflexota bacterium]MBT4306031.1 pyridoxal phosphate-dependent aminotransferase [Chloroflexota bacterium]MBT4532675.1 pyridoxal phosphate-dependent aminotransferase [Chloroflexota bacterium]
MSSKTDLSPETPAYVVPEGNLVPVSDHLNSLATIPPSRMFLIKKSLKVYQDNYPGEAIFDASQGDGGASLPGVAPEILQRAAELQFEHGTGYDMPFGTPKFREVVVENYWQIDSSLGFGPANVTGTVGGRDALVKAYQAMLNLGTGQVGDFIVVSRVPWISYNWGPYGIGANVMLAPGRPEEGWKYTTEGIKACVDMAAKSGRKIAGLVITCPDNPTGRTISMEEQAELGRFALENGVAFVLFDWIYHYVTDEAPMDLNKFLGMFAPEERQRIMVMDGLTKSLGASNIRSAHLIASEEVTKFIVARASHNVIPPYFSLSVAQAAYEMGYAKACRNIVEPTNASRNVLKSFLDENGFEYIIGKGYYAFINVGQWVNAKGWADTEEMGQYLAEAHGLAVVPGSFFSSFGGDWIRYSYATPAERTIGAAKRLIEGLKALEK